MNILPRIFGNKKSTVKITEEESTAKITEKKSTVKIVEGTLKKGKFWQPGTSCKIYDDDNKPLGTCPLIESNENEYLSFSVGLEYYPKKYLSIEFGDYRAPFLIPRGWFDKLRFNEVLLIEEPEIATNLLTFTTCALAGLIVNFKFRPPPEYIVAAPKTRGWLINGKDYSSLYPGLYWRGGSNPIDMTDHYALQIVLHAWNSQYESPFLINRDVAEWQHSNMGTLYQLNRLKEEWLKNMQKNNIKKDRFILSNLSDLDCLDRSLSIVQKAITEIFPSRTTMFPKIFNVENWGVVIGQNQFGPIIDGQLFVVPEYFNVVITPTYPPSTRYEINKIYAPREDLPH